MEDSPPVPRTITVLAFDVGIICTAAVKARFDTVAKTATVLDFCTLSRAKKRKRDSFSFLQDELLEWLGGEEMRYMLEEVDQVAVEQHWSGPRGVKQAGSKIRVLEFTIRQYYLGLGFPTRAITASAFKKYHRGACRRDYYKNKDVASDVALAFVIGEEHYGNKELMERTHDLGDAFMLACYVGDHSLDLSDQ